MHLAGSQNLTSKLVDDDDEDDVLQVAQNFAHLQGFGTLSLSIQMMPMLTLRFGNILHDFNVIACHCRA